MQGPKELELATLLKLRTDTRLNERAPMSARRRLSLRQRLAELLGQLRFLVRADIGSPVWPLKRADDR